MKYEHSYLSRCNYAAALVERRSGGGGGEARKGVNVKMQAEKAARQTAKERDSQHPLPSDSRLLEMGIFVSNSFMYPFGQ